MITLEKDIETKLVETVKRHGGKCLKWVCPGWSGVPDRIVLMPGARVVFVETKRPKGGRLSKLQKWWQRELGHLGFHSWTVWTEGDLNVFERAELVTATDDEHERQTARCFFCGRPFDTIRRKEPGADAHD